jgi:hypothetical protein
MDEQREGQMRRRFGMSRRDLIRRGAIVGGTLIWTIPVVQTLTRANAAPGSPTYTCCECRTPVGQESPGDLKCNQGQAPGLECLDTPENPALNQNTEAFCSTFCEGKGKTYCFRTSPTPLVCSNSLCAAPP